MEYNVPLIRGTNISINERLTTMAKKKGAGESISGYFRHLFRTNPDLLDHGKNDVILEKWRADHPGQPITDSVKNNMSNVKSNVRKEFGKVKRRRRRKGKRGAAGANGGAPMAPKVRTPIAQLERLEGAIDSCLSVARAQPNPNLDGAIRHLLAARRMITWEMGQPR
jgi:hypothetical protein